VWLERTEYVGHLAGGSQAMVAEKREDQNSAGRQGVSRFFFEFVS
jgi:hypothetical protein